MTETVLVTGGTGFVGNWVVLKALEKGYKVKTSVRNLNKEKQLRDSLVETSSKLTKEVVDSNLELFIADLTSDAGWLENFKDVDYVLHVASPFPAVQPKDPNELIVPAVEGTLRILRIAAQFPSVKNVVVTSSFAAVGFGHDPKRTEPFTEVDFTKVEGVPHIPYVQSKTLAEQAAWKYVKDNQVSYYLTVLNPAYIFGPPLKNGTGFGTSLGLIQNLLNGTRKDGVPSMYLSVVDVRQLADLHVESLTNPRAKGERFIVHAGPNITLLDVANILRESLPPSQTGDLPTTELSGPKDYSKNSDISKVKTTFNWTPYSISETLVATVEGFDL
ncbi:putative short chain dehydrogenase [Scheffersomyces xylosifermentans]|uniref:putative short chain dehydrogenase n=1 Tax=Scheffersomyces xylosifermentans TaxID=1304137 RepID=UPI00315C7070